MTAPLDTVADALVRAHASPAGGPAALLALASYLDGQGDPRWRATFQYAQRLARCLAEPDPPAGADGLSREDLEHPDNAGRAYWRSASYRPPPAHANRLALFIAGCARRATPVRLAATVGQALGYAEAWALRLLPPPQLALGVVPGLVVADRVDDDGGLLHFAASACAAVAAIVAGRPQGPNGTRPTYPELEAFIQANEAARLAGDPAPPYGPRSAWQRRWWLALADTPPPYLTAKELS